MHPEIYKPAFEKMSNKILKCNNQTFLFQEEIFLSGLLEAMNVSASQHLPYSQKIANLKTFINRFAEIPQIYKRGRSFYFLLLISCENIPYFQTYQICQYL